MKLRSANEVAILVALMMKRTNYTRAKISNKTISELYGGRLRAPFIVAMFEHCAEYGYAMMELDFGGFGVFRICSLAGTKSLTTGKFVSDEELDNPDYAAMVAEIVADLPTVGDASEKN